MEPTETIPPISQEPESQAKHYTAMPPKTEPSFLQHLLQKIRHLIQRFMSWLKRIKTRFLAALKQHKSKNPPSSQSAPESPDLVPNNSHTQDQQISQNNQDNQHYQNSYNTQAPQVLKFRPESCTASENFAQNSENPTPRPYNPPTETSQNSPEIYEVEPYTPSSLLEFINLIKRTPSSVLNSHERQVIASVMNLPYTQVSSIMLPPSEITYVHDNEVMGPLTLDRLYKSGYQYFPVIDIRRHIIGIINTKNLNSLEIKKTSRADEVMDRKVYYLRADYTLDQALAAFLRTGCFYFLVIDRSERIIGVLTYEKLMDYLFGKTPTDNFDRDHDRLAVAKRKL